jgi:lipid II:glycine glycyltransferase (peptidoglycan interpeptide bridge formation enzyme)
MVVSATENNSKVRELILKEFNHLVESRSCIASTIISNPLDTDGDKWLKENTTYNLIDERIGQITHFPKEEGVALESALIKSFEDPRPRNIRKAQKEGVKVYQSNTKEAMDFLYKTHYDNITAINGIAKEKRFFDYIPDFFSDDQYKIYIAEQNGVKIGALLLFYFNKTVEYFTPAVVEKYRNLQPTSLIIYQAMIDAIQMGYKNWNWGGTWLSQGGVYDFKKRWGTSDYRYYYYINVRNEKVYSLSKETLLNNFQYFFVLPFSALKHDKK